MTEPGDRVAIKRMSKRGVLRPVDQDDYHAEEGNGSGSESGSGSGSSSDGGCSFLLPRESGSHL